MCLLRFKVQAILDQLLVLGVAKNCLAYQGDMVKCFSYDIGRQGSGGTSLTQGNECAMFWDVSFYNQAS